jgi:O-antigen/teichoic acid export membrane protein
VIEHFKKIGQQSVVYAITRVIAALSGLVLVPILTRHFSPSDYGVIDLILTINSFLIIFLMLGLDSASARYYYDTKNKVEQRKFLTNALVFLVLVLIIVTTALVLLAGPISTLIFGDDRYQAVLRLNFWTVPFIVIFNYFLSVFVTRLQAGRYAVLFLFNQALVLGLVIVLLSRSHYQFRSIYEAYLLAAIVSFAVSTLLVRKNLFFSVSKKYVQKLLTYGLPLLPAGMALWTLDLSDRFFVVKYAGTFDLGIYALAAKIALPVSLVVSAFVLPWIPFAFSILKKKEAKAIYAKYFTYFLIAAGFCAILVTYLSKVIILLLANPDYLGARIVAGVLSWGMVAYGAFFILSLGAYVAKKTWYVSLAVLIAAAIKISLNFYMVPKYGILGAAITTLLAYIINAYLIYKMSQKKYFIPLEIGRIIKVLVLGAVLTVAYWYVSPMAINKVMLSILGPVVYLLLAWVLIVSRLERKIAVEFVKTRTSALLKRSK